MKVLGTIFLIVVIFFVVLIVGRNFIIKAGLEGAVEKATGLTLSVGSVAIEQNSVGLKNIQLQNPQGFADKIMLDVPEVYLSYNLSEIVKKNYHFPEARLHLKELVVIRNKDGRVNLEALRPAPKEGETSPSSKTPSPKQELPPFQIDRLKLKAEKVIYKDYTQGDQPSVQEFPLNIEEEFTDIHDLQALVSLIVMRTLAKTSVAQFANFDLNNLKASVSQGLEKNVTQTLDKIQKNIGSLFPASP